MHISVFKLLVSNFKSNLISETRCSLYSFESACRDANEACSVQTDGNSVCKCKPGYSKQNPTELCTQTSPNIHTDSHSEDQPTTTEVEYSSKVSGNDDTISLVHA